MVCRSGNFPFDRAAVREKNRVAINYQFSLSIRLLQTFFSGIASDNGNIQLARLNF